MIIIATVILLCFAIWLLLNWGCIIPSRKMKCGFSMTTLDSKTTVTANWLKDWKNKPFHPLATMTPPFRPGRAAPGREKTPQIFG